MMETQTLDQINKEAVETLYRELGVSRTIRFLRQYRLGKGNYVEIKREVFSNKTVEDITGEILEDFPDK